MLVFGSLRKETFKRCILKDMGHRLSIQDINEMSSAVAAGTENPSSGRTSSCGGDSSGIGSSLTSSSSSEPFERDTSPSEENGVEAVETEADGCCSQSQSQDVPEEEEEENNDKKNACDRVQKDAEVEEEVIVYGCSNQEEEVLNVGIAVAVVEEETEDPIPSPPSPALSGRSRTSSSSGDDTSGIGSNTSSASSEEPNDIERRCSPETTEEVNGDCSDRDRDCGGGGGGDADEVDGCSSPKKQEVPEKDNENAGGCENEGDVDTNGETSAENVVGDACTALLLCEDYNGQMTAAKRFLKMVRDGIKDDDDISTSRGGCTKSLGGSEASTDDDTTLTSKPAILINNNNTSAKEKTPSGGIGSGRASKVPNGVLPSVALAAAPPPSVPSMTNNILGNGPPPDCVQEVWAHNLLEEFYKIRQVVRKYNFIAMDTEFPGIVVRPQCAVRSGGMFPYEFLKVNVDQLKIIQLGVTFMDKNGKTPEGVCTWQFNFKFNLKKDLFAPDSISLLTRCGIQFEKHEEMGIEPEMFGEYFMSSGMVTSDHVTYLTFHSGFDFGYLIKLLSNLPLPDNEEKFFDFMRIYFPNVYDLKFLMKSVDLHGGLQDIANQMGQQRVGTQHQAGSDSLLTGMTFFKILQDVFNGEIDDIKYSGKLYGFHMTAEDGREEGWSDIPGDILDPTSPKPLPTTRTLLPVGGSIPLPHHSILASANINGDNGR